MPSTKRKMPSTKEIAALVSSKLGQIFEGREHYRKPTLRLLTAMYVVLSGFFFKENSAERNTSTAHFQSFLAFFTDIARERCDVTNARFFRDMCTVLAWCGPEEGTWARRAIFSTLACMRMVLCDGKRIDAGMAQLIIDAGPAARLPASQKDRDLLVLLALQPEVDPARTDVALIDQ